MRNGLWLLLWLCLVPATAGAAEVETVLTRLEGVAAGVKSLSSDFVQEKHLAMFEEVMTSRGRFVFVKPDRLRWELLEPVKSGFVLKGNEGRRWNGRSGGSEPFDLAREPVMKLVTEQLLSWARADFARLRKEYRISLVREQPVQLRLDPLARGGVLSHLLITFAADETHVESVEIHDRDGDFTRIRFLAATVNGPIARELF
jgi:outer membrane lipoprotein-sorting protein